MSAKPSRRAALAMLASTVLARPAFAGDGLPSGMSLGEPRSFSFETLVSFARMAAGSPFAQPAIRAADTLDRIDFPQHVDIAYREDLTIWAGAPYPVRLFHPGKFFKEPVSIHLVGNGTAREVRFSTELFAYGPKATFARSLPSDLGFSGFRVMNPGGRGDWLAFLGASYFRSAGELSQYGLSARGLAVDTGLPTPEEFPRFTAFYLEETEHEFLVCALLDSPSVTGAYRFRCRHPKSVVIDVEARLFARRDMKRLGIAPLTSMFWYSELNRRSAADWRPEVHDSDGLAIWTGSGERLWRPLDNQPRVVTSSFLDDGPKGFGLLQRDRQFASYEDDGVFYERRPSIWVETLSGWGPGAVQLLEIPTDTEIHDNIAAYWTPKEPVRGGAAFAFDYRLHWVAEEPYPASVGKVVSTRRGRAGNPAETKIMGVKFVIDFAGGELARYETVDGLLAVVSASRGKVIEPYAIRVNTTEKWRIGFDLVAEGQGPVDLRAFIRSPSGAALTETWISQYFPGA